jgi:hypothetical protein
MKATFAVVNYISSILSIKGIIDVPFKIDAGDASLLMGSIN